LKKRRISCIIRQMEEHKPKPKCPGSFNSTQPAPRQFNCPSCGTAVEIWSDEVRGTCPACGRFVFASSVPVCVEWCSAAEQCLGDVLDVKKIKAEALKRAKAEGDPERVEKIIRMVKEGPVCKHREKMRKQ